MSEQVTNSTEQPQTAEASARSRAIEPAEGEGIRLTEKAAGKITEILQNENYPDTMYLYVGVKGGGCSGLQPTLDLRDETKSPIKESDEVFLSNGVTIVCDLNSFVAGSMSGTTIDYQDGLMGTGFAFKNPNAKHSCGCGSSYSV